MHGERLGALAVLHQPRRAVAARAPQTAAFPAGFRIVDAAVEAFGVKAERIGHSQQNHLAVFQRDQAVVQVGGGHGYVLAEAERVVLIDPGIVARLRAVFSDPFEIQDRGTGKKPSLRGSDRRWPSVRLAVPCTFFGRS